MLAFAEPLWLLGLAAVGLPVALHLRGERPGRVVRVGSVRWLEGAPAAWAPATRLTRIPLLLLRCSVVATLALALARPYASGAPGHSAGAWVLVAPEVARHPLPDSLRRLGPARLLAAGLPPLDETTPAPPMFPTDIWSLLREADAAAPAGIRLVLVAPATLRLLHGARPELRHEVQWHAVAGDSTMPGAREALGAVTILAGTGRDQDARYLAAAFRAAATARREDATIAALPAADSARGVVTPWIAWLGPLPVPAALERRLREGARLLTDGDTSAVAEGDRVVWRGADGGPLLVAHARGRGVHYRLRGRFHPSALPAVLRPEFAEWIDTLWAPAPLRATAPDLPVSRLQRTPVVRRDLSVAPLDSAGGPERGRRTAALLLAAAAICWLAERAITARDRAA